MTARYVASAKCVCDSKEAHFVPPSFGEPGFFACFTENDPVPVVPERGYTCGAPNCTLHTKSDVMMGRRCDGLQ